MEATVLSALDLAMKRSTTYHKSIGARPTELGTARLEPSTSLLDSLSAIRMTFHRDGFA